MDEKIKEKIETRQEFNIKLLDILAEQVEQHPDLRFGQILINTNLLEHYALDPDGYKIFDPFYEEPIDTYKRVMETLFYEDEK